MSPRLIASAAAAVSVVAGFAVVVAPAPVFAAGSTLYVNNASTANCSDTAADAGSAAQPYCSLQAAVDAAQPGDTVQVANGFYAPVDIKSSGTASAPITITGPASGNRPSVATSSGGSGVALTLDHVHNVVLSRLFVASNVTTTSLAVVGSSDVEVDRSWIVGNNTGGNTAPAVTVDGQSSGVTLSQNRIDASVATALSLAPGSSGTVLTTNQINYEDRNAVTAEGSTGLVAVGNTFSSNNGCWTALTLDSASSGATLENNAITTGLANCVEGTRIPLVVSADSAAGTTEDYNTIETSATGALYSWAGQTYTTPDALHTATGQGAHDTSLTLTSSTTAQQRTALLIDSADADAPDETSTDYLGRGRVDDPLISNTGTGVGYYDRGAWEFQDPYSATPVPSATKGPAPLTENFSLTVSNPWNTSISSYTFDFGDGSAPVTSSTPAASHTYTSTGTYYVTVTAASSAGATFTGRTQVQVVTPAPLVPSLVVEHEAGQPSLSVAAITAGTTDAWSIADNTVDFGDGTAPVDFGRGNVGYHTYAKPGTYTATLTVKDDGGNTATTTTQVTVGSALVPYGPVRFLDTRNGTGAPKAKVGPGGVVRLKVAGMHGIPSTGVTAVTLNLTATNTTTGTWIATYPDGTPVPTASNLNLGPNQTIPNLVTVPVAADGYVDLYNHSGSVDLIADVEGYYSTTTPVGNGTSQAGMVAPSGPTRVLDTRTSGHPVAAGSTVTLQLPGDTWNSASSVVLNVTETDATAPSYVAVEPASGSPSTSILNFTAGQTSSNQVIAPVGPGGTVTLYNHSGSVDLIADLQGYDISEPGSPNPTGSPYFPINPTRVLDTRNGTGTTPGALGPKSKLTVKVAGTHGIPTGVKAVLVNLTGINPTNATWISAYADGSTLPNSSNLNLAANSTRAVLALVPVGSDGSITIYNANGSINLAADIQGYYTG